MKTLPPIKESPSDYEAIEEKIKELFKKEIYNPLLRQLGLSDGLLKNAVLDDLAQALMFGNVEFHAGRFTGKFNSRISKQLRDMGAVWDRKTSSYKLRKEDLSLELRNVISASEVRIQEKFKKIDKTLSQLLPEEIADRLQISKLFDTTLWKVDRAFRSNVKSVTIAPELSDKQRKKIADEWQKNMQLWITDFTSKEIKELRENVQKAVFTGNRVESIKKTIAKSYDVSERKAKFLARQETSLLMAKFKETRYVDAGINEYKWGCVHMPKDKTPAQHTPGNVRYGHGLLEGKIFRWDNPPVTSNPGQPIRRNNPGQDYNCRCFAKPIVRFKK